MISTNADKNTKSFAFPDLKIIGNGSLTKCLEFASETQAIIAGKPNPVIFDILDETHNVSHGFIKIEKKDCIFIGDNLYTDIKFANEAGVDSLLVLTGVTYKDNLHECLHKSDSGKPMFIAENLA